jgi:hypothetical protein
MSTANVAASITLRPSELSALLAKTIPYKHNVLVTGAPGLGKSDIVQQAARDAGADIILSHPVVADPTDPKGLPFVVDGQAVFLPFGDLHRAMTAARLTVWFLDDLGQASPAVQAAYMQLLLAREVNGHKISDHVVFVAATNRRTDRAGVSGILEPVKSRFVTIVELAAHIDDWCGWALDHQVPAELVAFLRYKPSLLCDFNPSGDLSNSPIPRTWAHVAKLYTLGLPENVLVAAYAGAVGPGAAVEWQAFLKLMEQLPNIDEILKNPDKAVIPENPAVLYTTVTSLGMRATVDNFEKIARYATRLYDHKKGEFTALLITDAIRHDKKIPETNHFVKLIAGPVGQLLSGGIK